MFSQNGLSLDQAPPISVVFRFFLSGALFGMVAGGLVLWYGVDIFDATSVGAVTLTHTLTLGVMLSFMFAALFQMLPVIAGVTLTTPVQKANWVQYPLVTGVLALLIAFNQSDGTLLFGIASLLLGGSILSIGVVMLSRLLRLQHHSASSRGMLMALGALMVVVLLALYLTATLTGLGSGSHYLLLKEAHYSFGLFGWVALLIISISFQVIEMFYVTPSYPSLVSRYLPMVLVGILGLSTLLSLVVPWIWQVSNPLLALLLGGYALLTLKRLTERKRPLTDATVWFWRIGLGSLLLSMLTRLAFGWGADPIVGQMSYLFFTSFALSIVFAMFYKIVPFLTWFHLNSQGYFTAPMMHEVIHPKTAKQHLVIYLATMGSFLLALWIDGFIMVAGLLTILLFGWIGYQVIHAWQLYKKTQATGEKFDMQMGATV